MQGGAWLSPSDKANRKDINIMNSTDNIPQMKQGLSVTTAPDLSSIAAELTEL